VALPPRAGATQTSASASARLTLRSATWRRASRLVTITGTTVRPRARVVITVSLKRRDPLRVTARSDARGRFTVRLRIPRAATLTGRVRVATVGASAAAISRRIRAAAGVR
jgi:hypothetical protein